MPASYQPLFHSPRWARSQRVAMQWAPKLVTASLVLLSLWILAGLIWALVPRPSTITPPPSLSATQNTMAANPPPTSAFNVDDLIQQHLFGKEPVITAQPEKVAEVVDAPETKLNLKLTGIIWSDNPEKSRALIEGNQGDFGSYAVGDEIKNVDASLHEIQFDYVVLDRNGRYEQLKLQKLEGSKVSASASKPPTRRSSGFNSKSQAQSISSELRDIRKELLHDPGKAAEYLRVRPVYNKGQLRGYRVYPGRDRAIFNRSGLRAGDLITSVNGTRLDNPQGALAMLNSLSSASYISLELERLGRTENLSVDLSQ